MYENEVYENEVIENETETSEVVTSTEDYAPAPATVPAEIIIPEATAESSGPNKALIAAAVVGGLFVAKKVTKKIKPKIEEAKAKKAAKKKQEILDVLIEAGVVQKPEEPKAEDNKVVDVPATEIKEAAEPTNETSEKEKKEEKK